MLTAKRVSMEIMLELAILHAAALGDQDSSLPLTVGIPRRFGRAQPNDDGVNTMHLGNCAVHQQRIDSRLLVPSIQTTALRNHP